MPLLFSYGTLQQEDVHKRISAMLASGKQTWVTSTPVLHRELRDMAFFASSGLAIAFGAFLICAETCLHFESLLALPGSWLALPIHDWLAGAFLIFAGVKTRRAAGPGRFYQLAAWAFNASLLCGAFFGHLEEWSSAVPADDWLSS